MAKVNSLLKILSLSKIFSVPKPKEFVKEELIRLLKVRLKKLKILWNPKSFAGGLSNPELPKDLIDKLEGLISLAEVLNWKLSPSAKLELDEIIEDIESFNPSFRKELAERIAEGDRENSWIPFEEVERKLRECKRAK